MAYLEEQIRTRLAGTDRRIAEYHAPDGFIGMAVDIPPAIAIQMRLKNSWKEDCPVAIADLSYLLLTHHGFDGKPRIGELVVHRTTARLVVEAFADLSADGFPIEQMELIDHYDADDERSMAANNSSAFNCRPVTGRPGEWSRHSYGGAIDINPLQNPYIAPKPDVLVGLGWDGQEDVGLFLQRNGFAPGQAALAFCSTRSSDCLVLPPQAVACRDRNLPQPGMLLADSSAVRAFTSRGFDWGGNWSRLLDYQHFEYDPAKLLCK